ncbi:pseudouridine synthase [Cognatilysobacter lacus]|uniref:Pseudouridine synthase n=1 Tax=Cognatilysobacter lacus TaxID=1643323 RepID=A0A5D8YXF1_9GAMM|nr:pseudouridine synthase [Lysobacter lacus]TZF87398.1 pseudouridine synthase [Lysobacter lacus]
MKPTAPPPIDGVGASRVQLRPGDGDTLLDALCTRFPAIDRDTWRSRFARSRVLDAGSRTLAADAPLTVGGNVYYYREVTDEAVCPAVETLLHVDDEIAVVDKPHGLAVMPAGRFASDTLLARMIRRLGNGDIVPLHRIDRDTAGLVIFSLRAQTRDAYLALFRQRRIHKRYEAIAPPLPALAFPLVRESRIERGTPFHVMREVEGAANSCSRIDVVAREDGAWRYALEPVSGRKHQLRVHMAALGAPIFNDRLYGDASSDGPLKLLAARLAFEDPVVGGRRVFESGWSL